VPAGPQGAGTPGPAPKSALRPKPCRKSNAAGLLLYVDIAQEKKKKTGALFSEPARLQKGGIFGVPRI